MSRTAITLGDRSSQIDDEVNASEYCAQKLPSFNESDLTKSLSLGHESICSLLGGEELQGNSACDEVGATDVLTVSHIVISPTPLKLLKETRRQSLSLSLEPPMLDPRCSVANVAFDVSESSENLAGTCRQAKVRMSDFGHNDRTVTSVGGVSTNVGLSDLDPMAEQCTATVRVSRSRVLVGLVNVEMLSREQLTAQEKFS